MLLIFLHIFIKMDQYWFVFLYRKDTKPVLKIPGFRQNIKDFHNKKNVFAFKKISKKSLKMLLIFLHIFIKMD